MNRNDSQSCFTSHVVSDEFKQWRKEQSDEKLIGICGLIAIGSLGFATVVARYIYLHSIPYMSVTLGLGLLTGVTLAIYKSDREPWASFSGVMLPYLFLMAVMTGLIVVI